MGQNNNHLQIVSSIIYMTTEKCSPRSIIQYYMNKTPFFYATLFSLLIAFPVQSSDLTNNLNETGEYMVIKFFVSII